MRYNCKNIKLFHFCNDFIVLKERMAFVHKKNNTAWRRKRLFAPKQGIITLHRLVRQTLH